MDASSLRPLGIGEILDAAINVYRSRFGQMVLAVAVMVTPTQFLGAFVALSVEDGDSTTAAGGFAAFVIIGVISLGAAALATAASMKIVSGAYLDQETDWRSSLGLAFSRSGPLLGATGIVFAIVLAVGVAVAFIGGAAMVLLAVFVLFPIGLYFAVSISVFVPVLVVEEAGAWTSLKRSRELVRGRWWPVFGSLVVAFLLSNIVATILQGIFAAATFASGSDFTAAIISAIGGSISSSITTPFVAAAIGVVYFDLRVRKEGFDLELLARTLGVDPPPAPPPPPGQGPGPLPRPPSF